MRPRAFLKGGHLFFEAALLIGRGARTTSSSRLASGKTCSANRPELRWIWHYRPFSNKTAFRASALAMQSLMSDPVKLACPILRRPRAWRLP